MHGLLCLLRTQPVSGLGPPHTCLLLSICLYTMLSGLSATPAMFPSVTQAGTCRPL